MEAGRIVVIGAAGEMTRVAVQRLAETLPTSLELYDLDTERLRELTTSLPRPPARTGALDLFDASALRHAIDGAALVVLGAGPYLRTAEPVMRACLEVGVNYLDLDDDTESTAAALTLDAQARMSGTALFIGCGASPGLSNVLALDAAGHLDKVDTIDVCWVSGDEGGRQYGAAVIEHILRLGAGPCPTWREGRQVTVDGFVASEVYPMGGELGDYRLYETAHPEAVTLPRRYPGARSIRVMGGGHPQPVNGMIRGVALAVERGELSTDDAVAWFQDVTSDKAGSWAGWRHALAGMVGQVRRGESSLRSLGRYLWLGARKQHQAYCGAVMVRATGTRLGEPATVIVRTPTGGPDSLFASSMAAVTGTCLAAFVMIAMENYGRVTGTLATDDWVQPEVLYATLERLGIPRSEVLATEPQLT